MPCTVEHIVACHQSATALRRAGKPIWPHKINLAGQLKEGGRNLTPATGASLANKIAQELRTLPASFFDVTNLEADPDFIDLVDSLAAMSEAEFKEDMEHFDLEPAEIIDEWLEQIYDWCDTNRVWVQG